MHARRTQRCVPKLEATMQKDPSKHRKFQFELKSKARLLFIYASAFAGLVFMLIMILAPLFHEVKAADRLLLDLGFSQNFLNVASKNLSTWRQQLFINTISLKSATEKNAPQGHERFALFNPVVRCPNEGEALQLYGGSSADDADGSKFLCPSLLESSRNACVVYSLGSNLDYTFELDVLKRTSCHVVTFDCTVPGSSIHPRHTFLKKCIGNAASMKAYPEEWTTLPAAMAELGHSGITVLKIDIEGFEFDFLGALDTIGKTKHALPAMIAMEMHYDDLYFGTDAWLNPEKESSTLFGPGHGKVSVAELSLFMFHLGNLGYALVSRDDNPLCEHCSEFTLLRVE